MIFRITSALDSSAATTINNAGKQRLLAQRTLTNALIINNAARIGDWDALEPALDDLDKTTLELQSIHSAMRSAVSESDLDEYQAYQSIELPILSMTNSTSELSKLTTSMIRRSPYIDDQTFKRVTAAKDEIAQAHSLFLPRMQSIVDLYEQDHKSNISNSISQSKVGMLILLVVLIASILFVVEPAILIIRRQIKDLDNATRSANRADAIRWCLLTNMGHEFRTPMNAIMGFTDLLSEDSLTESERSRLVKSVHDSSTQLMHLIESMLDMSAIQSGQLRVNIDQCNFHTILTDIKADTTAFALSKNLELNIDLDDSSPTWITTDAKRIEQILYNLIENAIKFTNEGHIDIRSKLSEDKGSLNITITDTGIGISPQDQRSIFDPFRQAEENLTRSFGGAGLGLAISRDLARVLGGDVTVESTVGKGSTFTLTIAPGEIRYDLPSSSTATGQSTHTTLKSNKILIVDDAKDNRILLQHFFKKTAAQIEFAQDGQQAIDAINAAIESDSPFDLVLMDMQMPVLDGYHATVQLRKQGITTPIIAVTSHALEGDREHCLEAGCNEYMSKPVNKSDLINACANLISQYQSQNPSSSQAA